MTTPAKVAALTSLVLVLAAAIAGIMHFHNQAAVDVQQPSAVETRPKGVGWQKSADDAGPSSTDAEIWSSVAVGQKIGNPFVFKLHTPFKAATWMLLDAKNKVLASGFVSSTGAVADVVGWYDETPKTKQGWFAVADALSSAMPPYRMPVELQTQTETVEAFFAKPTSADDGACDQAFPVKRQIVSTGGDKFSHYQAALHELAKGPSVQERAQGYTTALSDGVQALRVGQDEAGHFVADFPSTLTSGIDDACRLTLIKTQIQETLKTVPLQGRALDGRVYIQGAEAAF